MFDKTHSNKYEVLRCACGAHYLCLSFFPEEEKEKWAAYLNIEVDPMSLWHRIKWAVKYIFNRTNNWEEFIIDDEESFLKFKGFVDEIYEELVDKKEN